MWKNPAFVSWFFLLYICLKSFHFNRMKKIAFSLSLLFALYAPAQWMQVGTSQGNTSTGIISLGFKPSTNTPYIAYADTALNTYVVKYFNGSSWVQEGTAQGVTPLVAGINLEFDPQTSEPCIAYLDAATNAYQVKRFNGTSWIAVGGGVGFATGGIPSLAFNPSNNEMYIAFPDAAANAYVVNRYSGTSWMQVGFSVGTGAGWSGVSLKFNPSTNQPYIAYPDGALNVFAVQRYTGTSWTQVGGNIGFTGGATPALYFHPSTFEPHIAYSDASNNVFVVERFTGTAWTQLGGNVGPAANDAGVALTYSTYNNYFYCLYADPQAMKYIVKYYNRIAWSMLGTSLGSTSSSMGSIAFRTSTNEIYAAYPDAAFKTFVVEKHGLAMGMEVVSAEYAITVFPNPSKGIFNLEMSRYEDLKINRIEIYSVLGDQVFSLNLTASTMTIDLSEMPQGIYFCRIVGESGEIAIKKMVIQQ